MKEDKYKLFTQYMYNELGVSKDDIRDWIKEAIQEQAKQMLEQTHGKFSVKEILVEAATRIVKHRDTWFGTSSDNYDGIKRDVVQEVSSQVLASYRQSTCAERRVK